MPYPTYLHHIHTYIHTYIHTPIHLYLPTYTGNNTTQKKPLKVKRRIRKGIPDVVRRQAWGLCVGLNEEISAQPNLYTDLCARTDVPDQEIQNTIER